MLYEVITEHFFDAAEQIGWRQRFFQNEHRTNDCDRQDAGDRWK